YGIGATLCRRVEVEIRPIIEAATPHWPPKPFQFFDWRQAHSDVEPIDDPIIDSVPSLHFLSSSRRSPPPFGRQKKTGTEVPVLSWALPQRAKAGALSPAMSSITRTAWQL